MDLREILDVEQKPVSVFEGDGFCISRILARESSLGQSSGIFYRSTEGIPFKWEMQPGTPKNPQEEEILPPLSPPPSMHSFGLPLPNVDHDELKTGLSLKTSKILNLKKMFKKSINLDKLKKVEILSKRRSKQQEESSRFEDSSNGEFVASVKDSSFSSHSSSLSFTSKSRVLDSSRFPRDSMIDPFCCSPGNITDILDEENKRICYCKQDKLSISVEEDDAGSFSSNGEWNEITHAGIPFKWEMQPGTPKNVLPENDVIPPPPSPPPAVQSSALPRSRLQDCREEVKDSTWTKALFWIKDNYKTKKTEKMHHEISFRYSFSNSSTSAIDRNESSRPMVHRPMSISKRTFRMTKIKRALMGRYFLNLLKQI